MSDKFIEFTLIYNRFKTKVFNYVQKMVNDQNLTEDIVQNIFLKFYENLNRIDNKNSCGFWIFKTARNEVYQYYRNKNIEKNKLQFQPEEEMEHNSLGDAYEEFEIQEFKTLILNELDKMEVDQKEVYYLKEYGGFSYKEIAQMMEIDENLVKSRLYKVRQKLIKHISKMIK